MKLKLIAVILVAGIIGGAVVYFLTVCLKPSSEKVAYIVSQKVFDDYNGTKEIKQKIKKVEEQQKVMIDSMLLDVKTLEIKFGEKDSRVIKSKLKYNQLYTQMMEVNQKQSQEYNAGIWQQLNQYVGEYGRENKYKIIFGANGSGSLMYVDSTMDVSKEVIGYANKKYADK